MNWTSLLQPKPTVDSLVKGHFFVIKFTPDAIAKEVFNLGIGFIEEGSEAIRFKLAHPSLQGFACIYGKNAVQGLRLLLQSISTALNTVGYSFPPSSQVAYTTLMPVKGLSIEAVLNSLYRDYVHMDHFQENKKPKASILNTVDLRKGLKQNLKSINKTEYYQEKEIFLKSDIDSGNIALDLPIWRPQQENSLFGDEHLFASVVSADYIEKNALSFNLDYLGCSNIQNACLLTGREAKAGLFIYRPSLNERVTKEVVDIIDNHIEKSLYTLERLRQKEGYNIEIEVFYSEEDIYDKVATFVT
jgi:hypothetical protein